MPLNGKSAHGKSFMLIGKFTDGKFLCCRSESPTWIFSICLSSCLQLTTENSYGKFAQKNSNILTNGKSYYQQSSLGKYFHVTIQKIYHAAHVENRHIVMRKIFYAYAWKIPAYPSGKFSSPIHKHPNGISYQAYIQLMQPTRKILHGKSYTILLGIFWLEYLIDNLLASC